RTAIGQSVRALPRATKTRSSTCCYSAQPSQRSRACQNVLDSVRNARTAEVVRQRLDDMVAGLVSPRGNERLQLVREVVERNASSQRRQQADARRDSTYTDSRDGDKMIWYQRSINRR